MLDIVKIKNADYLMFYLKDNYIYCKNTKTDEQVIVGQVELPKLEINIESKDTDKMLEDLGPIIDEEELKCANVK